MNSISARSYSNALRGLLLEVPEEPEIARQQLCLAWQALLEDLPEEATLSPTALLGLRTQGAKLPPGFSEEDWEQELAAVLQGEHGLEILWRELYILESLIIAQSEAARPLTIVTKNISTILFSVLGLLSFALIFAALRSGTGSESIEALRKQQSAEGSSLLQALVVPWTKVSQSGTANGTYWAQEKNIIFEEQGIHVRFEAPRKEPALSLSLDANDVYIARFFYQQRLLGSTVVPAVSGSGMQTRIVKVSRESVSDSYDSIEIAPLSGDGRYSLGHLKPISLVPQLSEPQGAQFFYARP